MELRNQEDAHNEWTAISAPASKETSGLNSNPEYQKIMQDIHADLAKEQKILAKYSPYLVEPLVPIAVENSQNRVTCKALCDIINSTVADDDLIGQFYRTCKEKQQKEITTRAFKFQQADFDMFKQHVVNRQNDYLIRVALYNANVAAYNQCDTRNIQHVAYLQGMYYTPDVRDNIAHALVLHAKKTAEQSHSNSNTTQDATIASSNQPQNSGEGEKNFIDYTWKMVESIINPSLDTRLERAHDPSNPFHTPFGAKSELEDTANDMDASLESIKAFFKDMGCSLWRNIQQVMYYPVQCAVDTITDKLKRGSANPNNQTFQERSKGDKSDALSIIVNNLSRRSDKHASDTALCATARHTGDIKQITEGITQHSEHHQRRFFLQ
jgi:hypothetical protein